MEEDPQIGVDQPTCQIIKSSSGRNDNCFKKIQELRETYLSDEFIKKYRKKNPKYVKYALKSKESIRKVQEQIENDE